MIKIYRLEHKELKLGPYFFLGEDRGPLSDTAYLLCELLVIKHATDGQHPGRSDFPLRQLPIDSCYFGCLSEQELRDWFGDFYQPLLDTGEFVVNEYETTEDAYFTGRSHKQVCFNRETARLVE